MINDFRLGLKIFFRGGNNGGGNGIPIKKTRARKLKKTAFSN